MIEIISPGNPGHDYICKRNLYADADGNIGLLTFTVRVFVYYLAQEDFEVKAYTFQEKISVNIYDGLWIDFRELDLQTTIRCEFMKILEMRKSA